MRASAKAPKLAYSYEYVNGDPYLDMVVFFSIPELKAAGILPPSTVPLTLTLTGTTYGGTQIVGTDTVRTVSPST